MEGLALATACHGTLEVAVTSPAQKYESMDAVAARDAVVLNVGGIGINLGLLVPVANFRVSTISSRDIIFRL